MKLQNDGMKLKPIVILTALCSCFVSAQEIGTFSTTLGPVSSQNIQFMLPHEHVFTDLRGPNHPEYGEASITEVVPVMAPLLGEARQQGVDLLVECTTIGVGRNVPILKAVSQASQLPILVPTGVYGRDHFAPETYRNMSHGELTQWMVKEITEGIGETGIRAGFIKIATGNEELTSLEKKFLRAALAASSETGAAIASHTTSHEAAQEQATKFASAGVPLHRFIWVHAQADPDLVAHVRLARAGAWIEYDSVGASQDGNERILRLLHGMKKEKLLQHVLLSHDAGWYQPGKDSGGDQRPYTALTSTFLPRLEQEGFSQEEIATLTRTNPIRAFLRSEDRETLEEEPTPRPAAKP